MEAVFGTSTFDPTFQGQIEVSSYYSKEWWISPNLVDFFQIDKSFLGWGQ